MHGTVRGTKWGWRAPRGSKTHPRVKMGFSKYSQCQLGEGPSPPQTVVSPEDTADLGDSVGLRHYQSKCLWRPPKLFLPLSCTGPDCLKKKKKDILLFTPTLRLP